MVRRQGTSVRRHRRAHARRASGRAAGGGDPPGRGQLLRRGGRHRALPGAPGVLRAAREPARPRVRGLVGGLRPRLAARLRRAARPRGHGAVAAGLRRARAADREPRAPVPPAAGSRARPGGALDAVQRRAVQLLGGLRRGRADEGVPQGHPGREPRHRGARGADPGRLGARRRPLRLARRRRRRPDAAARDAAAVPAHGQRRLGPGAGQRPLAVRGPGDARPRLRRRLRRRVDPARRGAARGAPGPARPLPRRDPAGGRGGRARRDHDRTARGRAGRRTRAGGARRRRCGRRSTPSPSWTAWTSSGSTATCTSARPCAPRTAGRSSTSRASRSSRWPSGSCRTRRGATWPGCCAASTTPPGWSSGR